MTLLDYLISRDVIPIDWTTDKPSIGTRLAAGEQWVYCTVYSRQRGLRRDVARTVLECEVEQVADMADIILIEFGLVPYSRIPRVSPVIPPQVSSTQQNDD